MTKPILHHYPLSPFAEKIRRMLAYCECAYDAVETSPMLPRKDLDLLTGGYRRIPVAQWGSDIYCDSRAIAERIATDCARPELAPSLQSPEQSEFIRHVDGELFFAVVGLAFAGSLKQKMRKQFGVLGLLRFVWDRMKLMRGAKPTPRGHQAKALVMSHLADMESRLKDDYLFGDTPTLADFSAYHSLWFLYVVGEHPGIEAYPNMQAWMDRMAALGTVQMTTITAADSLKIAKENAPQLAESGLETSGESIKVLPDDYGLLPVTGQLVLESEHEFIIARRHVRVGEVHVHFPKQGFRREL